MSGSLRHCLLKGDSESILVKTRIISILVLEVVYITPHKILDHRKFSCNNLWRAFLINNETELRLKKFIQSSTQQYLLEIK